MKAPVFDIAVIGGGVNGCGIARDASGRGLSVYLCEQNDLASGTSSASTKLIHGGLRYLEYYEFRLVREALTEREVLLRAAPHIIWPLRFILPHHKGLRPAWLIRLGLFIYDNLGGRKLLPGTSTVDLTNDEAGTPLKDNFSKGFEYSDCWVIDSRLVVLNAMDAAAHGAEIHTRTTFLSARREDDHWKLIVKNTITGEQQEISAKTIVNASGPWMDSTLKTIEHTESSERVRMVKGSHIIVNKLFNHQRAYIFQNPDGRIIFSIPYEEDFTLIGTTDADYTGDPSQVKITEDEISYLCNAASEYFTTPLTPADVISTYSGIRPLFDDGKSDAKAATRDYVLQREDNNGSAPLLSIYGGKITTYRKLAESVLEKLRKYHPQMGHPWTADVHMPGGNFHPDEFNSIIEKLLTSCKPLDNTLATRLVRNYGTRAFLMCKSIVSTEDLGQCFGGNLYEFEVSYLIEHEWAKTAEDILWRRTKLGLVFNTQETETLANWMKQVTKKPILSH